MTEHDSTELRRSPGLAVLGVLALLVAAWGVADGPQLGNVHTAPWAVLAVGTLIGLALVFSGMRRR